MADLMWRPIETAPKDGTEILVFCPYEKVGTVRWWDGKNHHRGGWQPCSFEKCDWENGAEPNATHWMPLPSPPQARSEEISDELDAAIANYANSGISKAELDAVFDKEFGPPTEPLTKDTDNG